MNRPVAEPSSAHAAADAPVYRRHVRFELIFASVWLAIGLFALPATIFAVGGALLGPYRPNGGLGRFYGDFFADLAEPSVRAWASALGPLVLITLIRLVFVGAGRRPDDTQPETDEERRAAEEARRIEPRVSVD